MNTINVRETKSKLVLDALIAYHITFRHAIRRNDFEIHMPSRTALYGDGGSYIEHYTNGETDAFENFITESLESLGFTLTETSSGYLTAIKRGAFSTKYTPRSILFWKSLLIEILGSEITTVPDNVTLFDRDFYLSNISKETYQDYLQSPEWQQKALQSKERVGWRCQICNTHDSECPLDAHHRTYERIGQELPEDIVVLCRDCHSKFHDKLT